MRLIDGVRYYDTAEVVEAAHISRQTLWRWRREGVVSDGHRFRGNRVLFSESAYAEILAYANRLEPGALGSQAGQLILPIGKEAVPK